MIQKNMQKGLKSEIQSEKTCIVLFEKKAIKQKKVQAVGDEYPEMQK